MAEPLVIVSNRGPVGFRRVGGELRTVRGAGGLVSALRPLVDRHDVAWVATALGEGDRAVAADGPREAIRRSAPSGELSLAAPCTR